MNKHITSYPRFLWRAIGVSTDGSWVFYTWMTVLTAVFLVGVNAWAHQLVGLARVDDRGRSGGLICDQVGIDGKGADGEAADLHGASVSR